MDPLRDIEGDLIEAAASVRKTMDFQGMNGDSTQSSYHQLRPSSVLWSYVVNERRGRTSTAATNAQQQSAYLALKP